jgi:hypothetical protein
MVVYAILIRYAKILTPISKKTVNPRADVAIFTFRINIQLLTLLA